MALFQIDEHQFNLLETRLEQLNTGITEMSANLAKWQASQTTAIQTGFASLIAALTGADVAEIQQRINALTNEVKTEADALEGSAQSET